MCIKWRGEWHPLAEDMFAYKVCTVREGRFHSMYKPDQRVDQSSQNIDYRDNHYAKSCIWGNGSSIEYQIGDTIESDMPGMYLYHARKTAMAWKIGAYERVVLKVRIPAGTMICRGSDHFGLTTINATRIEVLEQCV